MSARLDSPIKTPSGIVFTNRLVKAAMAEGMSDSNDPGDRYITAYTAWADGGWGASLTGNVDVSTVFMGSPDNIAIKPTTSKESKDAWTRWALAAQAHGTPTLVQIVHPGRQSPAKSGKRGFFDKSIAPSAVPLNIGPGLLDKVVAKLVFGTPREMTVDEIKEAVDQFAAAAKQAHEAGFKGIEIHAAHGYLLSQFLSPKSNIRTDEYGGTPTKRARILVEAVRAIRAVVSSDFCVGIKLNSADVGGKESLEESLEQIGVIAKEEVDFLEISGGSYENPRMAAGDDPKAKRTAQREAFFLDYARAVRARYPDLILMVTGGFRTRQGMQAALETNACDLIGIGRPGVIYPHLPKDVYLNKEVKDEDAKIELADPQGNWITRMLPIKMLGAGVMTMYYVKQIQRLAVGKRALPPGEK